MCRRVKALMFAGNPHHCISSSPLVNIKIVLRTGAKKGIAFAVAKGLLEHGHLVILAARLETKVQEAISKLSIHL